MMTVIVCPDFSFLRRLYCGIYDVPWNLAAVPEDVVAKIVNFVK